MDLGPSEIRLFEPVRRLTEGDSFGSIQGLTIVFW